MGFKDRLREKRVEANLTQAALAEKVSVTARTIQNYELGSRKPTKYEVVKKIAEALNTTPEYLLGNSGMLVLAGRRDAGSHQSLLDCKRKEQEVHAEKVPERTDGRVSPVFGTGCLI